MVKYISHECRNWECGRAVSFLRIFVLNFRYSVFEVHYSAIAIKTYYSQLYKQSRAFTVEIIIPDF